MNTEKDRKQDLREAIRDNANKNKSISDIVDLKNNIVQSIKAGTRSEIIKSRFQILGDNFLVVTTSKIRRLNKINTRLLCIRQESNKKQ